MLKAQKAAKYSNGMHAGALAVPDARPLAVEGRPA